MQSLNRSSLVVDASIILWAVLPSPIDTLPLFEAWEGMTLLAPDILLPEVISSIRYMVYGQYLTEEEGMQAIEDVFRLGVEICQTDRRLALSSLAWAGRLQQRRAYDALYVALAEDRQADFWSADKRLVNGLKALGIAWAHWAGEGVG